MTDEVATAQRGVNRYTLARSQVMPPRWVTRLEGGQHVYLVKERRYVCITRAWEPINGDPEWGRISFQFHMASAVQHWCVSPDGDGADGQPLLHPARWVLATPDQDLDRDVRPRPPTRRVEARVSLDRSNNVQLNVSAFLGEAATQELVGWFQQADADYLMWEATRPENHDPAYRCAWVRAAFRHRIQVAGMANVDVFPNEYGEFVVVDGQPRQVTTTWPVNIRETLADQPGQAELSTEAVNPADPGVPYTFDRNEFMRAMHRGEQLRTPPAAVHQDFRPVAAPEVDEHIERMIEAAHLSPRTRFACIVVVLNNGNIRIRTRVLGPAGDAEDSARLLTLDQRANELLREVRNDLVRVRDGSIAQASYIRAELRDRLRNWGSSPEDVVVLPYELTAPERNRPQPNVQNVLGLSEQTLRDVARWEASEESMNAFTRTQVREDAVERENQLPGNLTPEQRMRVYNTLNQLEVAFADALRGYIGDGPQILRVTATLTPEEQSDRLIQAVSARIQTALRNRGVDVGALITPELIERAEQAIRDELFVRGSQTYVTSVRPAAAPDQVDVTLTRVDPVEHIELEFTLPGEATPPVVSTRFSIPGNR